MSADYVQITPRIVVIPAVLQGSRTFCSTAADMLKYVSANLGLIPVQYQESSKRIEEMKNTEANVSIKGAGSGINPEIKPKLFQH